MLTSDIAQEIVKETMTRLHRNINIMDETGTIIASGDPARLNQFHAGAWEVIQTGKPLIISESHPNEWRGSRPGINLPIEFKNKIVGVIGITGEPQEVEEFSGLVKMTTEIMMKQSYLASLSEWKQRTKEMVMEEMIKSEPNNEWIDRQLDLLDLELLPPFQISIIEMKEITVMNQILIKQIEEILEEGQFLAGFLRANRMVILTSGIDEEINKRKILFAQNQLQRLGLKFRIGYGTPADSRSKIRSSYEEAKLALFMGNADQSFVSYLEIETKALVYQLDGEIKERYLKRIFPNASDKNAETLEAFFASNLNITEAAEKLYIHRNTLIYRLKKIKDETGYNPQIFQDALALQLAVWIYQKAKTK